MQVEVARFLCADTAKAANVNGKAEIGPNGISRIT